MGESEAVTPAEEAGNAGMIADDTGSREEPKTTANTGAGDIAPQNGHAAPPSDPSSDPWAALIQEGAQLVSALAAANDPKAPPHPWLDRDPATCAQSLKLPLPPKEATLQIASALSALADGSRRGAA